MADEQRTLGEHGARLDALERDIGEIKGDVKSLLQQVSEARGGWRGMMALAGFASAVGAALTWIVQHFWIK